MLKKQNLRISLVKKAVKNGRGMCHHIPMEYDPKKMFGVYLSLRATDKLMAKLFRITFYIVNRPSMYVCMYVCIL